MICIGESLPDRGTTHANVAIVGAGRWVLPWPSACLAASAASS
jgi:hypothetical protein